MMKAIEIKNLAKHFDGVSAIDRFSIAIPKGKITAVIGPNGSGKTTLINVLSGLLPIDGGTIVVGGAELRKIVPHSLPAYGMTRTFQNVRLFEQMTVLDNVLVVLTERSVSGSIFERHGEHHLKKAEEFLRRVGLWEKRSALAANLSYGQRKLLEIARALAMHAEIYLFDEPFAGLFKEIAKIVSDVLGELRNKGKTIILIEHDMGLIRGLSDYVFVMDGGKLLAEGKPEIVLKKREVIETYLGE